MKPSEFKLLFIDNKGIHERDIRRDDHIISHRYSRLMKLSHSELGDIYVETILWDHDKRVDIVLSEQNTNSILTPLKRIKFYSKKYKSDPYLNIIRLQYINKYGEKTDHTIETLEKSIGQKASEYFNERHIKLLKQTQTNNKILFFAQHQYYLDIELLEIYLVAVFIPFINSHKGIDQRQTVLKSNTKPVSSLDIFRQKALAFIVVTVLFVGCFTLMTRKRIGATCRDGTTSHSTGSGTCSHHGGVSSWTYQYWWDKK